MARITVEDCLEHVDNRFDLVIVGSKRARQIAIKNKEPLVDIENDKPTVLALREIELGLISPEFLKAQDEEQHDSLIDDTQINALNPSQSSEI